MAAASPRPVGVWSVFAYTLAPGNRSSTVEAVEWVAGRRLAWDGPPLPWLGGAARPRGVYEVRDHDHGSTLFVSRYEPELLGTMTSFGARSDGGFSGSEQLTRVGSRTSSNTA